LTRTPTLNPGTLTPTITPTPTITRWPTATPLTPTPVFTRWPTTTPGTPVPAGSGESAPAVRSIYLRDTLKFKYFPD
jgi:hypothetical protein